MSISGVGASTPSYLMQQAKSGSKASFETSATSKTAATTTSATSDTATISPGAQAADAALAAGKVSLSSLGITGQGPAYSQSFFDTINSLRGQDEINAYTSAANEVSKSQGLPDGQFDFTKMTTGQTFIAANYLGQTKQATPAEVDGMTSLIGYDWTNQTYNLESTAKGAAAYETAAGNPAGAAGYQNTADMIDRLESLWKGQMQAKAVDDTDKLTSLIDASRSAIAA